ncbi:MAG: S41 family peptidase, partial [Bacilli bacterium]|nr:S41 family peptidase [Bacilli bacterium]
QEETDEFNEQVEGKYQGVGVEIVQNEDQTVEIYRVFDDSPAKKAGLKAGDIIQKIGTEDVTGKTSAEISDMIRGSKEKKVTLTVLREGEEKEFTLEKTSVDIESVTTKTFERENKKIGYIAISIFASNTEEQFGKKLKELEKEGIDGLIIDVRGNSGGYLTSVTDIASMFLEKGKVIYQLDTKGIIEQIRDQSKEKRTYPVAVLINKGSASASEILAAALHESYGAYLVGTSTYGKGTVQRAYELKSGATVKYTIQKWLTPDGNWINETGLTPTHLEELNVQYYVDPKDENDNQLQRALDEISK